MNSAKAFLFGDQVTVFVCGNQKRVTCSSHDCGRPAARTCCFPVKREGEQQQCDRPVCLGCAVVIDGKEHCAAHGRVAKARKP